MRTTKTPKGAYAIIEEHEANGQEKLIEFKVKHCPYCEKGDKLWIEPGFGMFQHRVCCGTVCDQHHSYGPWRDTRGMAVRAWNNRRTNKCEYDDSQNYHDENRERPGKAKRK